MSPEEAELSVPGVVSGGASKGTKQDMDSPRSGRTPEHSRPSGSGPDGERPPPAPAGPDAPADQEATLRVAIRYLNARASRFTGLDREDLVQEALARAHAQGMPATELPWLTKVMRRVAIDRYRRGREIAVGSSTDMEAMGSASVRTPEEQVLINEQQAAVRCAMEKLPVKYREVITGFAQRQDPAELARRLGVSLNAAYLTMTRARRSFADALARCGLTVRSRVQQRTRDADRNDRVA